MYAIGAQMSRRTGTKKSYARGKILTDNARALLVEGRQPVTLV
jgi:hypothetical protein